MKTSIKISFSFIILISIVFSCKKKDNSTPPPSTTTTTTGTTTGANPSGSTFTAVINNQNWAMGSNSFGPFIYLYNAFPEREFGGQNNNSSPFSSLKVHFMPAIGTFTLSQTGTYRATFTSTSNINFISKTGTINIASYDTSGVKSPFLDKLKCTFSFISDSVAGQSYTVTNAYVDFIKN